MKLSKFVFVCFIGLFLSLASCHKDKKDPYVLTGRLVTDCNGTPYANKELKLYQEPSGGGIFPVKGGTLTYTSTDANGYFRFEYFPENNQPLWINSLVKGVPVGDTDIGELVIQPTCRVYYRIKVLNSYSATDTLEVRNIFNPPSGAIVMPGPFQDTIIGDSVVEPLWPVNFSLAGKSEVDAVWVIYNTAQFLDGRTKITAQNCGNISDTLTLIIE